MTVPTPTSCSARTFRSSGLDLVVLATGMVPNSTNPCAGDRATCRAARRRHRPADRRSPVAGYRNGARSARPQATSRIPPRRPDPQPAVPAGAAYADPGRRLHRTATSSAFPTRPAAPASTPAGPVRRPMDMVQAREDATGATLKAIQALENAQLGRAAHPRSGDLCFPTVRPEGCTQCKRCTVECPFGAIDEDEKSLPMFNESRCRRCGTCMGACPVRIISLRELFGQHGRRPDQGRQYSGRIFGEATHPDAGLRERRLSCARHGGHEPHRYQPIVRVMPVRCLGSVNTASGLPTR